MRFIVLIGIVNLFADMTYEGARSVTGAFLGHLGASSAVVGLVAGAGELAGYAVRSVAGYAADRTGRYWIAVLCGYAINLLCVPALAFAGQWPLAAGLIVGERFGRGIRKPAVSAMIARAGTVLGSGRVFGINEMLDQVGAAVGPLIIAFELSRGAGFQHAFAVLFVPALIALAVVIVAMTQFHEGSTRVVESQAQPFTRPYWLYVAGGALVAFGFADYALVAFHFNQAHVVPQPIIPVSYSLAMVTGAIAAPILGRMLDRYGVTTLVIALVFSAASSPFLFFGNGWNAQAGIVFWGIGMAAQESLILAVLARVARRREATAFGVYDTIFGIAWFAGSALLGFLYARSLIALVTLSAVAQLAAIPFFVEGSRRMKNAARLQS
ncbi:MAG: MFS transporter [Vulcanimicrobiaceae bacterium]